MPDVPMIALSSLVIVPNLAYAPNHVGKTVFVLVQASQNR